MHCARFAFNSRTVPAPGHVLQRAADHSLVALTLGRVLTKSQTYQCPVWPTLPTQVGHHPRSEKGQEETHVADATGERHRGSAGAERIAQVPLAQNGYASAQPPLRASSHVGG